MRSGRRASPRPTAWSSRSATRRPPRSSRRSAASARRSALAPPTSAAQIDAQQAESPLGAGDMTTVLIGEHDVLAEYQKYPAVGVDQLIANVEAARRRGRPPGQPHHRHRRQGAARRPSSTSATRLTRPPSAQAHADTDRAALLSQLSQRFNASMRATIVNDGRKIGLILLDELSRPGRQVPGLPGVHQPLRRRLRPDQVGADAAVDPRLHGADLRHRRQPGLLLGRRPAPRARARRTLLGSAAISRAQNNPF